MMTSDTIEFNKKREIGDIITDTFKFLRKNIKPLFSVLLKTLLVPFILLVGAVAFYSIATGEVADIFNIANNRSNNISNIIIAVIVLVVTVIIYSGLLYGSISEYIKEYQKTQGNPNIETILQHIKTNTGSYISLSFWNLLYVAGLPFLILFVGGFIMGASIFSGILAVLGALIYIIYLYTRYAVIFPAFTHKNVSATHSFSSSTALVRDEWWNTFIVLFLLGLITAVISFVFQIPAMIYVISKELTGSSQFSYTEPTTDWILIIFQTISSSVGYLLYTIPAIAVNFIYFNLSERKDQTGSLERINAIGRSDEE